MIRARRFSGWLAVAWAAAAVACAARAPDRERPPDYEPDRGSYAAFQSAHPDLLEPNYLPWMLHRIPGDGPDGDAMVFCRWDASDLPLSVYIEPPLIPDALQNEFEPVSPAVFVAAVDAAVAMWESDLEGAVRFRRVSSAREAELTLRLIASRGPVPNSDVTVLGNAPVAGACSVDGPVSGRAVLDVDFSIPSVDLYLADEHGLLGAEQVQWIALHEIGHALGMRRHSPIPADLMFEVVRNRVQVGGLSTQDIHSFVSLYQIANGTVFARLPAGATSSAGEGVPRPDEPPALAMAPFVDPRHGFQIHPPRGWMRIETPRGMATVDGLSWEYSASLQVIVEQYPTIEAYLERFGAHYLAAGRVVEWEFGELAGLRSLRMRSVSPERERLERFVFIEAGDGRLFVLVMDCAPDDEEYYTPWFTASVDSLEIWQDPSDAGSGGRRGG